MIFTHAPLLRRRYVHVPAATPAPIKYQAPFTEKDHSSTIPSVNVLAHKDHFEIRVALPGFTKEDVTIAFENDTLVVTGTRREDTSSTYSLKEFSFGNIRRAFTLPKIHGRYTFSAEMSNGILSILVAKPEEPKPLQINVL
jgi:HSP20 family protein